MVESHFHLEGVTIMLVLPNTNIMTIAVKLPTDPAIRAGIEPDLEQEPPRRIAPAPDLDRPNIRTGTTEKDSARSRPENTCDHKDHAGQRLAKTHRAMI
jgi:hypothetical protein